MPRISGFSRLLLTSTCALLVVGCSVEGSNLSTEEQLKALGDDMRAIFGGQQKLEQPLTLADAPHTKEKLKAMATFGKTDR